jgi:hypothetical protein
VDEGECKVCKNTGEKAKAEVESGLYPANP